VTAADDALAFAAVTALDEGRLDRHLFGLHVALQKRRALYDSRQPPPRTADMEDHQVWAWMNVPGRWEIRGTGAMLGPSPRTPTSHAPAPTPSPAVEDVSSMSESASKTICLWCDRVGKDACPAHKQDVPAPGAVEAHRRVTRWPLQAGDCPIECVLPERHIGECRPPGRVTP
jgi:hypothetical protein